LQEAAKAGDLRGPDYQNHINWRLDQMARAIKNYSVNGALARVRTSGTTGYDVMGGIKNAISQVSMLPINLQMEVANEANRVVKDTFGVELPGINGLNDFTNKLNQLNSSLVQQGFNMASDPKRLLAAGATGGASEAGRVISKIRKSFR
jgi:hypothetical protein